VFRTLYGRLAAVLVALVGALGLICLAGAVFVTRLHLEEIDQRLNRSLAADLVKDKIPMTEGGIDQAALKDIFHMLMVINPRIECYLLDPQGAILAFSAPPGKVVRRSVSLAPVERLLGGSAPLPIRGDDPRGADRRKIFSAAPIQTGGELRGYLYVVLGGEEVDSVARMLAGSYTLRVGLGMLAAVVIFGLLSGLVLFHLLTRRVRRLAAAMDRFQQGGFAEPVELVPPRREPGDEIDRLRAAFEEMAARITEQVAALKRTDALRRELVANVSHDLRTPLASLQGYLETLLLKEDRLPAAERRRYLETAARHSERLGRLVGELFELARLDAEETRPQVEPFPLAELVQDVVQKLRLDAEGGGVRLTCDFRPDLPFVAADIGLVERVLVNLLDNALRHTPNGGQVRVALAPTDGAMEVRVEDSGCGIPPEDLPYIFDRYYRVKTNQRDGKAGAGLGLAIARRIVELHGGTIQAKSAHGAGSTFTFRLPLHRP